MWYLLLRLTGDECSDVKQSSKAKYPPSNNSILNNRHSSMLQKTPDKENIFTRALVQPTSSTFHTKLRANYHYFLTIFTERNYEMRTNIAKELLETERAYVSNLNTLYTVCLQLYTTHYSPHKNIQSVF